MLMLSADWEAVGAVGQHQFLADVDVLSDGDRLDTAAQPPSRERASAIPGSADELAGESAPSARVVGCSPGGILRDPGIRRRSKHGADAGRRARMPITSAGNRVVGWFPGPRETPHSSGGADVVSGMIQSALSVRVPLDRDAAEHGDRAGGCDRDRACPGRACSELVDGDERRAARRSSVARLTTVRTPRIRLGSRSMTPRSTTTPISASSGDANKMMINKRTEARRAEIAPTARVANSRSDRGQRTCREDVLQRSEHTKTSSE